MNRYRIVILLLLMISMLPVAFLVKSPDALNFTPATVQPFFQGNAYLVACGAVLVLFSLLFVFSILSGSVMLVSVLLLSLYTFLGISVLFAIGYFLVDMAVGLAGLAAYIGSPALVAVVYLLAYFKLRRNSVTKASAGSVRRSAASVAAVRFDMRMLYSAVMISIAVSVLALCVGQPTYYLMLPAAVACLSILLWRILKWRAFLLFGFLAIELFILAVCVPAASSMTSEWFWRILILSLLYLCLLTPLASLYCHREKIA